MQCNGIFDKLKCRKHNFQEKRNIKYRCKKNKNCIFTLDMEGLDCWLDRTLNGENTEARESCVCWNAYKF